MVMGEKNSNDTDFLLRYSRVFSISFYFLRKTTINFFHEKAGFHRSVGEPAEGSLTQFQNSCFNTKQKQTKH
jgi:hypothetical protein